MGVCGQKNKGQEDNRRKQGVKEKNGDDSIAIENEMSALRQPVIVPSMSAGYLIRMACRACTEPIGVDVISAMSIRDYNTIRTKARNFLMLSDV